MMASIHIDTSRVAVHADRPAAYGIRVLVAAQWLVILAWRHVTSILTFAEPAGGACICVGMR